MEYQVNPATEVINILNNLAVLSENTEYATSEVVVTNFKINYSSFANPRLNSALQSMMNLYMSGYVSYHVVNGYLNLHHRIRDVYAQLIQIQSYRVVIQNDFYSLPLDRNMKLLLEQATQDLKHLT